MIRAMIGISFAGKAIGIAAAVEALVVEFDAGQHVLQLRNGAHDVRAFHGVLLHQLEFFVGELAGLFQDAVVDADLAHVVQQRRDAQPVEIFALSPRPSPMMIEYFATRPEWPRVYGSFSSMAAASIRIDPRKSSRFCSAAVLS